MESAFIVKIKYLPGFEIMIQKFLLQSFFALAFALIFGASAQTFAQGDIPINGSVGNGRLEKGKSAVVSVVLDIPGGLHVNSNRPSKPALIATRLRVTAPGLKVGAISYPRGAMKKFGFSDTPLSIYEGRTVLRFNVTVPPNFKGNVARIRAVVDYQPCTDEVCYRPRSGDITLSAAVR